MKKSNMEKIDIIFKLIDWTIGITMPIIAVIITKKINNNEED